MKGDLLALGSVPESQGPVCPSELYPEEKRAGKCHFYSPPLAPLTRHFWKPNSETLHLLHLLSPSILLQTCSTQHSQASGVQPLQAARQSPPCPQHTNSSHTSHSKEYPGAPGSCEQSFSPLGNTGCLLHKAQSTAFKTWRYS